MHHVESVVAGVPIEIIFEARSTTHLLYMYSEFQELFYAESSMVLFKGSQSDLKLASGLIRLPPNIIVMDLVSMDRVLLMDFIGIRKIKRIMSRISTCPDTTKLCTSYGSGIYFELIKSCLSIKNDNVILFDDGLSNELVEVNPKRVIRSFMYIVHGIYCFLPKYKLFSDPRFKQIYTSICPEYLTNSKKLVTDISSNVGETISRISNNNIKIPNPKSALLMTTHSVESKRSSKDDFENVIKNVVFKLKDLGVRDIYLSKHPAEHDLNNSFYQSIGLITEYKDCPSELLVANQNITVIANPYNSTLIISDYIKLLGNIEVVVSYWPLNAPHKDERVRMIEKIVQKYTIQSYTM